MLYEAFAQVTHVSKHTKSLPPEGIPVGDEMTIISLAAKLQEKFN